MIVNGITLDKGLDQLILQVLLNLNFLNNFIEIHISNRKVKVGEELLVIECAKMVLQDLSSQLSFLWLGKVWKQTVVEMITGH